MQKIALLAFLMLVPPPILMAQAQQRPVAAILDLSGEGVSKADLGMIGNLLNYAVSDTYMAETISSSRLERVLSDNADFLRDCVDVECALVVGKLCEADIVIAGSLRRIDGKLSLDLYAVDVASSEVAASYSQIHDSTEDIIDNIAAIALLLVREFTGQQFPKIAVLEKEGLSLLKVASAAEGASVYIDGVMVGKITGGEMWKLVPHNQEITLMLKMKGFYSHKEVLFIEEREITVQVDLEKKVLHRFALDGVFGGGSMGSLRFSVFPVAGRWFITGGMGFTVCCLDPLLVNLPVSLRTGLYLFPDNPRALRFYTGIDVIFTLIRVLEQRLWIDTRKLLPERLNSGFFVGSEYQLSNHIRAAFEVSLFPYLVFGATEEGSAVQLAFVLRVMLARL